MPNNRSSPEYLIILDSGFRDCVTILICHCERTTVRVAILIYPDTYEIASIVSLSRKDIPTQSLRRNGIIAGFIQFCKGLVMLKIAGLIHL
jgi:hypothetical protein